LQFIYLNTGKSVRILFIIASLLKEKTAKAPKNGFFAVNNFRHCKNLGNTKYIEKTVLLPERFIPKTRNLHLRHPHSANFSSLSSVCSPRSKIQIPERVYSLANKSFFLQISSDTLFTYE